VVEVPELPRAPFGVNLLLGGGSGVIAAPALAIFAPYFESLMERVAKVLPALVSPAVLCVTALGAITIIITVLVPALMPLFADNGANPPLVLRLGHALGQGFGVNGSLLVAGLIGAGLALRSFWRRPPVRAQPSTFGPAPPP